MLQWVWFWGVGFCGLFAPLPPLSGTMGFDGGSNGHDDAHTLISDLIIVVVDLSGHTHNQS
jgi:hypothetical protein